jgi:hypothetical protein
VALLLFSALAAAMFVYTRASSVATTIDPQQKRRRMQAGSSRRNTGRQPQTTRRRGINYSRFLHDNHHVKYDKAKRANCNECHSLASPLQFDIKDYPDHPDCVGCHRQQFFKGARPVICTVCHKTSSPRDDRRFAFPKPGTNVTREFPGHFPHALHQDLLARNRPAREFDAEPRFLRASFNALAADAKTIENCATCHASYDINKKGEEIFFPVDGWPDNMLKGVGTYRKIPTGPEGHRTCFTCHASSAKEWESPEPVANDCAGCHSKSAPGGATSLRTASTPTAATTTRQSTTPVRVSYPNALLPPRIVPTFQHEGGSTGGSHEEGCTTCHINITQAQTLVVQPDVPISSCAICHIFGSKKSSLKKGTVTTITTELDAWLSSKEACVSCHTLEVGSRPPPCSHYYADRRPIAQSQCK